jgi:Tetratricopeptide repeat
MELNTTNDTSSVEAVTRSPGSSVLTDRDPGAHAPRFMLSCATRTVLLKNHKIEGLPPIMSLTQIDALLEHGELANYYLAHSARADMYRRLGRTAEARASYEKALALTQQKPERQFLQERIRQLK